LSTLRRNTEIECLRAIAVLGVIFHHMLGNLFQHGLPVLGSIPNYFNFWFGVDLFFSISGYVIARTLLPQLAALDGRIRQQIAITVAFWIRRAWRLLPSAWLWLGLMLLAVVTFNHSGVFGSLHANLMATVAGVLDYANFRFADALFHHEYGASFVYWSLSLEEQFYFLLPLFVLCLRRRVDVLIIVLVVAQLGLVRTPLLMSLRTDALALGVLLAIASPSKAYARIAPRCFLALGAVRWVMPCLLLTLLSVLASPYLQTWRFHVSAIAFVSTILVWIASFDQDYLFPPNRIRSVLAWIGARSYAMYLIHIPVFFLLRETCYRFGIPVKNTGPQAGGLIISAACLIALFAELNYRYIECPLRRHGRHIADRFLLRRGHMPAPLYSLSNSVTQTSALTESL
jgi:peptidoglycan/LPS O-acetylase OafA/YrhL